MKTIHGPDFKLHFVVSNDIYQDVYDDLRNRFDILSTEQGKPFFLNEGKLTWDTGGTLLGNDIKFSFPVSEEISLICRSQHWTLFKNNVLRSLQDKRVRYFKLHSQMFVLCLTEEQITKLMSQIIKHSLRFDQIAFTTTSRVPEAFTQ